MATEAGKLREDLIERGGRALLEEVLRREQRLLAHLENLEYFSQSPVGQELIRCATLHRIALRNVLADICPEWADRSAPKPKKDKSR